MNTLYPTGYGDRLVTLDELLEDHHGDKIHPEFARRLRAWLAHQGGTIGIGGSWRAGGAQPDKPGFAPEGKSFHQYQSFNDGRTAFAAVDLVARNGNSIHRSPIWDDVPAQGTAEARKWGVHCNVGTPGQIGSEPWHMQPVEIDGWQSWWNAGRPSPAPNYPIPGAPDPGPTPTPDPTEDDDMPRYITLGDPPTPVFELHNDRLAVWVDAERWATLADDGAEVEQIGPPAASRMVLVGTIDDDNPRWHPVRDMFGQVISA